MKINFTLDIPNEYLSNNHSLLENEKCNISTQNGKYIIKNSINNTIGYIKDNDKTKLDKYKNNLKDTDVRIIFIDFNTPIPIIQISVEVIDKPNEKKVETPKQTFKPKNVKNQKIDTKEEKKFLGNIPIWLKVVLWILCFPGFIAYLIAKKSDFDKKIKTFIIIIGIVLNIVYIGYGSNEGNKMENTNQTKITQESSEINIEEN